MKCVECHGTRLKPHSIYKGRALYTQDECLVCGGKGYVKEGEKEFTLQLHVNGERVVRTLVIARTVGEALMLAGELIHGSYDTAIQNDDVVMLEVEGENTDDGA